MARRFAIAKASVHLRGMHEFDEQYWDNHWQQRHDLDDAPALPPNPHLVREVGELDPGTALEAGCGEGAEAIWLARAGWTVLAADIAAEPLLRATERATASGVGNGEISWLRADLSAWDPRRAFDLVTTHYAHPAMPQLEFYDRLSRWVAPGGTLLIVGHLAADHAAHHGHAPSAQASLTPAGISERFDPAAWDVVTAAEHARVLDAPGGGQVTVLDVVVRAVRRSDAPTDLGAA
jgi:SAM-dependent methyltransferase